MIFQLQAEYDHPQGRKADGLHQIENVANYVTYLRDNPSEVKILFKDLLIRVTRFFRDPEAFELLRNNILPVCLNVQAKKVSCASGCPAVPPVKKHTQWPLHCMSS